MGKRSTADTDLEADEFFPVEVVFVLGVACWPLGIACWLLPLGVGAWLFLVLHRFREHRSFCLTLIFLMCTVALKAELCFYKATCNVHTEKDVMGNCSLKGRKRADLPHTDKTRHASVQKKRKQSRRAHYPNCFSF